MIIDEIVYIIGAIFLIFTIQHYFLKAMYKCNFSPCYKGFEHFMIFLLLLGLLLTQSTIMLFLF